MVDEEAVTALGRFITDELTIAFAVWGEQRGLPLFHWVCTLPHDPRCDLFIGFPTAFYDSEEGCAQAALWANTLGGFELHEDVQPGCLGYVGGIAGIQTTIVAVNNRDDYQFWLQTTGPDEPEPETDIEPDRRTDYLPWPDIDLGGLDEIRALTKLMDIAFSRAFGTWALMQDLPPISWMTNTPRYSDRDPVLMGVPAADTYSDESVEHAERWAQALGLRERYCNAGLIKHIGDFAGVPVLVAAVTNRTDAENIADRQ